MLAAQAACCTFPHHSLNAGTLRIGGQCEVRTRLLPSGPELTGNTVVASEPTPTTATVIVITAVVPIRL
eukprot:4681672-Alexandrium_andersonii.AAC.1